MYTLNDQKLNGDAGLPPGCSQLEIDGGKEVSIATSGFSDWSAPIAALRNYVKEQQAKKQREASAPSTSSGQAA